MALPLLPDPVLLTVTALLAQTPVTALSPRVQTRTTSTSTYPLYVVSLVDEGESPEPTLGEARLQVDCWGGGNGPQYDQQALTMARTVRSVARDLKGTYAPGSIARCDPGLVVPSPEGDTGRARFLIDLVILTCP